MKWPWVSRETLEAAESAIARLEESEHRSVSMIERLLDANRDMQERMFAMKREGYSVPPPPPEQQEDTVELLPQPILDAIEERAEHNPALARQLRSWAGTRMRGEEADLELVREEILTGGDLDEVLT